MADLQAPDDRVLVVADVNVFLDVARLTGEPFTWAGFDNLVTVHATEPNPHPNNGRIDSLRAIHLLRTARSPLGTLREVWTSDHINEVTAYKATQDPNAADPRDRGLGWSDASAQQLIDELIWGLVDASGGDITPDLQIPYGSPPLDHEDGMVFATARDAGFMVVDHYERYVVTRDKGFWSADLPGQTTVLRPADWIDLHRGQARAIAMKNLLGR